jgi:hypothetical protein
MEFDKMDDPIRLTGRIKVTMWSNIQLTSSTGIFMIGE